MADGGNPGRGTRTYGRRAFLGVSAVGLSSLIWGRPAWQALSGVAAPVTGALPAGIVPSAGWRIYTVASSMPRYDATTWRLTIDGLVGKPQVVRHRRA